MSSRIPSRRLAVAFPALWMVAALGCAHPLQGPVQRPAPEPAAAPPPSAATIPEVLARMRGLGFEPAGEPEEIALRPGARLSLDRSIAAGDCAVFGAVSRGGGAALILRMRRGDELLAADTAGRPGAFVAHCAEDVVEVRLELEIAVDPSPALPPEGKVTTMETAADSEATLLAFRAPRSTVPEWAGPALGTAAPPRDPAAAEPAIARRLEAAGYEQGRVLLEAAAARTGDRHRLSTDLAPGQCGMLVAVAGPGVGGLVVEVRSGGGAPERAVGDERRPALLSLCRADDDPVMVEMAVIAGSGPVRATFHPLPEAGLPPSLADPPLALREAAAIFARHGMTAMDELPSPSPLPHGGWSARFEARPGSCYGLAAARRDGVPLASFRAVDTAGNELGRWNGPAAPALLARCVHGAPQEIVLEIIESPVAGEPAREAPVIAVFSIEASAAASLVGR